MSHTVVSREPRQHRKTKFEFRIVLRDLLLTVGCTLLLYVAYETLWTNVTSKQVTKVTVGEIHRNWSQPQSPTHVVTFGEGFALLYIPKLGSKVHGLPIVQGTSADVLAKGAGHYSDSEMPGERGNFAIAGHRSTHTEPFAHIDALAVGDFAYVQTRNNWLKYKFVSTALVQPEDVWVIGQDPENIVAKFGSDRLMTVTTCNPRWGSTQRWVWWAILLETTDGNKVPTGLVVD